MPTPDYGRTVLEHRFKAVFSPLFPKDAWADPQLASMLGGIQYRMMDAGTVIVREGAVCPGVSFVVTGCIRVFRTSDSGREISLYRIQDGQSCLLGSACGTSLSAFPASAITEQDTVVAFLPGDLVRYLFDTCQAFRNFALEQFAQKLAGVMEIVEEIAFRRVDERLRDWLLDQIAHSASHETGVSDVFLIRTTHQNMADHLGTSREVVSRILKDWEARNLVVLGRNSLTLKTGFMQM